MNRLWNDKCNEYRERLVIVEYEYEVVLNNMTVEAGSSENMTINELFAIPNDYGYEAGFEPVLITPTVYELHKI